MTSINQDWKRLKLRRSDHCSICGAPLEPGATALWSATRRTVSCLTHPEDTPYHEAEVEAVAWTELLGVEVDPLSQGIAGGSARAENERRVKKREDRITTRFPRIGKYILALSDDPQTTRAWETGAKGEVAIGRLLDSLAKKYDFRVLHDRLIPGSRRNIDHIAITRFGVFVIDAKNFQGVVRVEDRSGFFERSAPELYVGRRNCMNLVAGMKKQTAVVGEILDGNSIDLPVLGVLAFYAADWETFRFLRGQLEIDGVLINSKGLETIVSRDGLHTIEEIRATAHLLATRLVSAT